MLVADASVLVRAVVGAGQHGEVARRRLAAELVAVPDLARIEALSTIRRLTLRDELTVERADVAVRDLAEFEVDVYPTDLAIDRAWELRANVTPYDACYVALAEALDAVLLTLDARLAAAPGPRCRVEVL